MFEAALPGLLQPAAITLSLVIAGQRAQCLRCVAPCQPLAAAGKKAWKKAAVSWLVT